MQHLYEFLNQISPLTEESWVELNSFCIPKEVRKKTIVSAAGTLPENIYFLSSGAARAYLTTDNGTEYNKALFTDSMFFGSFAALIKNNTSQITYETISNCKILEINYQKFMHLVETRTDMNILYRSVLENIFLKLETRDIEMVTLNATERYLKLKQRIPNIDKLIPQYHIASNIGITAIQLSRIRKGLQKNQ